MHDIEPFYHWRNTYIASEDDRSPFYDRQYNEFQYTNVIYNYYIHPQWDFFGSPTLYIKILFTDYEEGFAIIEMLGEWNDCLSNDIMYLKNEVVDHLVNQGIYRFILICENVLNFHGSDDCYYEEWMEDVRDEGGWICCVNTLEHVAEEMKGTQLQYFINFGENYNDIIWRPHKPKALVKVIDALIHGQIKRLSN
ncbi:MAG: hypothetical protein GY705_16105 [Bacteroidetes bacterium]|nr:hypothetical protein [Bacteroidota bacterium]